METNFKDFNNEKILFSSDELTDIVIVGNMIEELIDDDLPLVMITEGDYEFYVTKHNQKKEFYACGLLEIVELNKFIENVYYDEDGGFSYVLIRNFIGDLKLRVRVEAPYFYDSEDPPQDLGYINTSNLSKHDLIDYDLVGKLYSPEHYFYVELDITDGEIIEMDNDLYKQLKND